MIRGDAFDMLMSGFIERGAMVERSPDSLIEYDAPDVSPDRQPIVRKRLAVLLVFVLCVKLLFDAVGDRAWNVALSQFWQQKCLRYNLPADRIAFVAAPSGQGQALPTYLGEFAGAEDRRSGTGWSGTVGASPYPIELAEFKRHSETTNALGAVPWESLPGPVFLHGLNDSQHRQRLVTIYALANNPSGWWTLVASVNEPVGLGQKSKSSVVTTASWPMPRTASDTLVVFAGQPDPKDPSRFTLRVSLNGRTQIVTGVLRDDATIEFTSSTGFSPWNSKKLGPIVLPTTQSADGPLDDGNILLPVDD